MNAAYIEKRRTSHHQAVTNAVHEQGVPREHRHGSVVRHSYSAFHPFRSSMSNRRGVALNIPRFHQVPGTRQLTALPSSTTQSAAVDVSDFAIDIDDKDEFSPTEHTRQHLLRSHSLGPLTPPQEIDIHTGLWSENVALPSRTEADHDAADYTPSKEASSGARTEFTLTQLPRSELQSIFSIPSQRVTDQPLLDEALRTISRQFESQSSPQYIELVSQVLPNRASDRRLVKTSELVCDHLQQTLRDLQGITITHAISVPQSQVVEDFPKSPPTTPNFRVANGYFDEPIVVTKAANVPVYHGILRQAQEAEVHIQRRIMVRSIVDLALLERCIPPTTPSEIGDFFDADSHRSYLADRLSELSIGHGSLLLIYPTRAGGQTFARKYVAPILDPLLREMSILRSLDTNAAQKLGTMEALDSMPDFEDMKGRVGAMCNNMSNRCRTLIVPSSYTIVHCQKAAIILDKATWMTWYVEQEQARMKQNLVDYHKDGGRLPLGESGTSELTAGMLTREIIEGLQKSKKEAGNVGIEVGIFLIKRAKRAQT